jgi:arylsulfatase A-like enzyme
MKRLLLPLVLACAPLAASAEPPPNLVFVMADDLGWADVAFHEGAVPTPRLDRLRAEGVELARHYVAPVCSPTRAGLMTGRCWSRFGVTTPTNERALPPDTLTLPRALKAAGYETCLVGKWHLGSRPDQGPHHYGFDHGYGSLAGGVGPYNHFYKEGPHVVTWHRMGELVEEEGHVTDLITDEALAWIEGKGKERPFFLYVPYTAVHLPVKEPRKWLDQVPPSIEGEVARHYAACVLHLDDSVGRLLDAIDGAGLGSRTLFVFTSDNGGSTAENNDTKYPADDYPQGRLPGSNHPWRGQKGSLYEGGVRVPTLARWSGRLPAGTVCEEAVHVIDWMPTFCALAGAEAPRDANWDGRDIFAAIAGEAALPERVLYSAGPSFRSRAVWRGGWKLLELLGGEGREAKYELYHLGEDPGEGDDRAAREPDLVAELKAALDAISSADRDAVAAKD